MRQKELKQRLLKFLSHCQVHVPSEFYEGTVEIIDAREYYLALEHMLMWFADYQIPLELEDLEEIRVLAKEVNMEIPDWARN